LRHDKGGKPVELKFELKASDDSPIVNPAFVIENWGLTGAELKLNSRTIRPGRDFRLGHRSGASGYDLIVWIKAESNKPTKVSLSPVEG
jgi:hypothetical protein